MIFYTKLANKFFFIQNMAEWHFSCCTEFNKSWLSQYGPLNKKQINILQEIKHYFINKKFYNYKYKNQFYYLYFFTNKKQSDIYKHINKYQNKNEMKLFDKAFIIFDQYFDKIWKDQKQNLEYQKHQITSNINKYQSQYKILQNLYNSKSLLFNHIDISLLISCGNISLGYGTPYNTIAICCSDTDKNIHPNYHISTIFHEYTHMMEHYYIKNQIYELTLENNDKIKYINKLFNQGDILNEIVAYVISSYFDYNFFNYPKETNVVIGKSKYKIRIPFKLIDKYIQEKKPINKYFISKLLNNIITD